MKITKAQIEGSLLEKLAAEIKPTVAPENSVTAEMLAERGMSSSTARMMLLKKFRDGQLKRIKVKTGDRSAAWHYFE